MPNKKRTALLIHCSVEEAAQIREAAKRQDRTISGYVVRAVKKRMELEWQIERTERNWAASRDLEKQRRRATAGSSPPLRGDSE